METRRGSRHEGCGGCARRKERLTCGVAVSASEQRASAWGRAGSGTGCASDLWDRWVGMRGKRALGLVCLSAGPGKGSRVRCAVCLSGAPTRGSGVALKREECLACWVTGGKEGGGGGLGRSGVREEVGRFARGFGFWFWVSGFLSYLLFSFLFSILILKQTHMLEFKSEFEFKPQSLN